LRQLKAELRIAQLRLVQRLGFVERAQIVVRIKDALANLRWDGVGTLIVEILHRPAQIWFFVI
jgi:hypothetical protein